MVDVSNWKCPFFSEMSFSNGLFFRNVVFEWTYLKELGVGEGGADLLRQPLPFECTLKRSVVFDSVPLQIRYLLFAQHPSRPLVGQMKAQSIEWAATAKFHTGIIGHFHVDIGTGP